jgi:hypothetical protein
VVVIGAQSCNGERERERERESGLEIVKESGVNRCNHVKLLLRHRVMKCFDRVTHTLSISLSRSLSYK